METESLDKVFEEIYGVEPDTWVKVRKYFIKEWNKGYPIGYYGN